MGWFVLGFLNALIGLYLVVYGLAKFFEGADE